MDKPQTNIGGAAGPSPLPASAAAPAPVCIFCALPRQSQYAQSPSVERKEFSGASATDAMNGATPSTVAAIPPPSSFIYSDELVYVIADRRPAARLHLLVNPHEHIRHCKHLTHHHKHIVAHMERVARQMLQKYGREGEQQPIGFHVPPFISVAHLHLHVLSGPFGLPKTCSSRGCCPCCSSCCHGALRAKYAMGCCWFRSMDSVLRRIEDEEEEELRKGSREPTTMNDAAQPLQQSMG